jgi:hypothetical protein
MKISYFFSLLLIFSIFLTINSSPLEAQATGANKIYITQFNEMCSKVSNLLNRVMSQGDKKMTTREEIFALTKLIHRFHEESAKTNADGLKNGLPSNKTILLIGQGCQAMDFVLNALDNYIDTEDRSFIALAKRGDDLIKAIEKLI